MVSYRTVIIQAAHFTPCKLMPICLFIVDTMHEVITSHMASTQLDLLKVLCSPVKTPTCHQTKQNSARKQTSNATQALTVQYGWLEAQLPRLIWQNTQYVCLNNTSPNILPRQHGRCRVSIEKEEEIEAQVRKMMAEDVIIPQVEFTRLVSFLTYPCKANRPWKCVETIKMWPKQ